MKVLLHIEHWWCVGVVADARCADSAATSASFNMSEALRFGIAGGERTVAERDNCTNLLDKIDTTTSLASSRVRTYSERNSHHTKYEETNLCTTWLRAMHDTHCLQKISQLG